MHRSLEWKTIKWIGGIFLAIAVGLMSHCDQIKAPELAGAERKAELKRVAKHILPVKDALRKYLEDHGHFPKTLEELQPHYYPDLPRSIIEHKLWDYDVSSKLDFYRLRPEEFGPTIIDFADDNHPIRQATKKTRKKALSR